MTASLRPFAEVPIAVWYKLIIIGRDDMAKGQGKQKREGKKPKKPAPPK
jgi:hypothetical protein